MPPQDTDSLSDRDLLIRVDERTIKIRGDQKEMKVDVGKINGRLRAVETGQSALKDRMKLVSGIVTGAVGGVIGLFIKQA